MVTITTSTLGMILSMLYIVQNMYVFEYIYIYIYTHTHIHAYIYKSAKSEHKPCQN